MKAGPWYVARTLCYTEILNSVRWSGTPWCLVLAKLTNIILESVEQCEEVKSVQVFSFNVLGYFFFLLKLKISQSSTAFCPCKIILKITRLFSQQCQRLSKVDFIPIWQMRKLKLRVLNNLVKVVSDTGNALTQSSWFGGQWSFPTIIVMHTGKTRLFRQIDLGSKPSSIAHLTF